MSASPHSSPPVTRRRFLAATAAAAGSALAACSGDDETSSTISITVPSTSPKRGRAVVVGGGLAGLVAAWQLQADDWDVVVLEADERLGGRVVTVRDRFDAAQHAEAGAEFIDPGQQAVLALASDLSLPTVEAPDAAGAVVPTPSGPVPMAAFLALDGGAVGADLVRWDGLVASLSAGVDPEDPTTAPGAAAQDARPVSSLLDEAALHSGARFLVERRLGRRYGVTPHSMSTLFLLQQTALGANGPLSPGRPFRVAGGTDLLVARLGTDLGGIVTTGAEVTEIDQSGTAVRVTHTAGHAEGDAVVCAVPLTTLGRIRFTPTLPPELTAATAIPYGAAVVTLLQYRTRPWVPLGLDGSAVSPTLVGTVWEATAGQAGPNGILSCVSSGDDAEVLGAQNEDGRVGGAATTVDGYVPGSSALLDAAESVVWRTQRHVHGTNVVFGPGKVVPFWNVLRRPHGRVHFAGEHTDSWVATMEGAVRSGQRAAREIREAPRRDAGGAPGG